MNLNTSTTPLICNMDVFTPTEREDHIQSTTQLYQCVQSIHEVENGYEFISLTDRRLLQDWEILFQTSGYAARSWNLLLESPPTMNQSLY